MDERCEQKCGRDPISLEDTIRPDRVVRIAIGEHGMVCHDIENLYNMLHRFRNMEPTSRGKFKQSDLDAITEMYRRLHPDAPALQENQDNPMQVAEIINAMGAEEVEMTIEDHLTEIWPLVPLFEDLHLLESEREDFNASLRNVCLRSFDSFLQLYIQTANPTFRNSVDEFANMIEQYNRANGANPMAMFTIIMEESRLHLKGQYDRTLDRLVEDIGLVQYVSAMIPSHTFEDMEDDLDTLYQECPDTARYSTSFLKKLYIIARRHGYPNF